MPAPDEIVVFLGPTLPHSEAQKILPARYLPPAQMGDVYRILATGVKWIILIDGTFHQTASIWHRELLEAMHYGITVFGVSSMGAMRAAELAPYGMIGLGTVFEWYRDGVIDGDDEPAIFHSDAEMGYHKFSEPLVNIRYTLRQAVETGQLSTEREKTLVDLAKNTHYSFRSFDALLNHEVVQGWTSNEQQHLASLFKTQSVNLKRKDAIEALQFCAMHCQQGYSQKPQLSHFKITEPFFQTTRQFKRGFQTKSGEILLGERLIHMAREKGWFDDDVKNRLIRDRILDHWMVQRGLRCPDSVIQQAIAHWKAKPSRQALSLWLKANGMIEPELKTALERWVTLAWIRTHAPEKLGLASGDYQPFLGHIRRAAPPEQCQELEREVRDIRLIAAWANENGIVCPPEEIQRYHKLHKATDYLNPSVIADWALHDWIIAQEPKFFGDVYWSVDGAFLQVLQISDGISALLSGNQAFVWEEPDISLSPSSSGHTPPSRRVPSTLHLSAERPKPKESLIPIFTDGTHRMKTPEQTLAWIAPHLLDIGITRCADITHLDTELGVPTFSSIRPCGQVLQTSNGKGMTRAAAQASAFMEAIELHHAENPEPQRLYRCSSRELKSQGDTVITPEQLTQRYSAYWSPDFCMDWVKGEDLLAKKPVWLPACAAYFLPQTIFRTTTNGLASGNHLVEATLHALYEVLERDAVSSLNTNENLMIKERCTLINWETLPSETLKEAVRTIVHSGTRIVLLWVPSAIPIHTFWCVLLNDRAFSSSTAFTAGYGTHTDPLTAASRAITEAVQSRLAVIAGSREDIIRKPGFSAKEAHQSKAYQFFSQLEESEKSPWQAIQTRVPQNEIDLNRALERLLGDLKDANRGPVIRMDLTSHYSIPVVKVITPALQYIEKMF